MYQETCEVRVAMISRIFEWNAAGNVPSRLVVVITVVWGKLMVRFDQVAVRKSLACFINLIGYVR